MGNSISRASAVQLFVVAGGVGATIFACRQRGQNANSNEAQFASPLLATESDQMEPPPQNLDAPPSSKSAMEEKPDETTEEQRQWAKLLIAAAGSGKVSQLDAVIQDAPRGEMNLLLNLTGEMPPHHSHVTAVYVSAAQGHVQILLRLLDLKADPNIKGVKASSWDGAFTLTEIDTPLCLAARDGHLACVEALLEANADPNVECDSEYLEGSTEWGEDDDGTDNNYYSALDVANMFRQSQCSALIEKYGGKKIGKDKVKPFRMKVTQGSRMGA